LKASYAVEPRLFLRVLLKHRRCSPLTDLFGLLSRASARRIGALLACFLMLGAQPASAQLPALGDGSEMSLAVERRLGDRIAREIYRDADYIDDPLLTDYVQSVWAPLQAAARLRGELPPDMEERFAWVLMLIRDRSVNAFALPGGYMGVHLGLIGLVANRDELASVLAHELSHVTQRHISRLTTQQGQQMPWLIGAMVLGALAASKSPNAANAMIAGGQALAVQNQLNFSRDMEREADRIGYSLMAQAGYTPKSFVSMFEKLQQSSRLNDSGAYPYLRSHPLTSQRIADMQLRLEGELQPAPGLPDPASATAAPAPAAPVAPTLSGTARSAGTVAMAPLAALPDLTHAMLSARARILADPGVDVLRSLVAQADSVASSGAMDGTARQAALLYSAALASMKLRDTDQAERLLTRLQAAVRFDAPALRLARLLSVELALQAADPRLAARRIDPSATDRPTLFLLAQVALLAHKKSLETGGVALDAKSVGDMLAEVLQRLQVWVSSHPRDGGAWQQLASVAAAQNQPLRAVRAEAEAHAAYLDYPAAVDRFRAAQDLARKTGLGGKPGDHIEASIIDTRLRQVESVARELAREQALQR
jgi:predicted Zn-dependent protease